MMFKLIKIRVLALLLPVSVKANEVVDGNMAGTTWLTTILTI